MTQLRQHEQQIDDLNLQVLVITFESNDVAEAYVNQTALNWPLLVDTKRALYRAYSMSKGSLSKIYGPTSWATYGKLLMRGRSLQRPTGDVRQLGGDVLIDPDGLIQLHHVGSGPADRPTVESILQVVTESQQ